ncbi:uncharacterized protein I303_103389 [Kwoniella dejecticola CBS 10117]|uniref:RP/EB family microtubule-associated protein n=1 Tax=Kwoniella dejecticola CBS 10117 TaxID=1296121 RepID=A0A1A6A6L6_9TREE|nr:RP/EB family microtubule-associated protein [Kwoniella dejecticola CBS 10117]OBR85701.1 RP/EB family microtubule-associated protein [Kwoniella dejecticola CBS 10117]
MSVYVGESRGELLAWLNELLEPLTITKVEQCGTGSVYCQIIDSIYGDLPMSKVKFNAKMEYEYLDNFKILQKAFNVHRIEKPIPVDKLSKCKMQDNLEFLQWMKKFWDTNSGGIAYDAQGRAGGTIMSAPPPTSRTASSSARAAYSRPGAGIAAGGSRQVSMSSASAAQVAQMQARVAEIEAHSESLLKERDFYFDKLRNIEVIVQERTAVEGITQEESDVMAKIQEILYATIEGFEVPEGEGQGDEPQHIEEEETF